MELIPSSENPANVREEANRRAAKHGYCDRDGQPIIRRIVSQPPSRKYRRNYSRVFGHD